MRVFVNIPFDDLVEGVHREIGERFSCDSDRAEYLRKCAIVEILGEDSTPEHHPEAEEETKPKSVPEVKAEAKAEAKPEKKPARARTRTKAKAKAKTTKR